MLPKKTEILIVPGYQLYPSVTGAGLAQFNFIDRVRKEVRLSLLLSSVNVAEEYIAELKEKWSDVDFFFWEKELDRPVAPTVGERIIAKLSRVFNEEDKVSKVKSTAYHRIHYNVENILLSPPEWMARGLDELLGSHDFDLIQFDLPINMGLAKVVRGRARTLFVHHEIKFKRVASIIKTEGETDELWALHKKLKIAELTKLNQFNAVQVFSDEDGAVLSDCLAVDVLVCPFSIPDNSFRQADEGEALKRLLFIGSDQHAPNLDALDWTAKNWMNDVKLKLHVLGDWEEGNISRYSSDKVVFEGFVPSLLPWFRNSLLLAPIRQGAGLRTKIMESLAASAPVVATTFAVQGLYSPGSGVHLLEDGNDFPALVQSFMVGNAYNSSQVEAFRYASKNFSNERILDQRLQIFDKLLTRHD